MVSCDFLYFGFLLMKNAEKKYRAETIFSCVFSDDTFHIIFDNVLLKDSVQIFCRSVGRNGEN